MEKNKSHKIPKNYECFLCDVKCCHKGDFNKHILTSKHKKTHLETIGNRWKLQISQIQKIYVNVEKYMQPNLGYGNTKRTARM